MRSAQHITLAVACALLGLGLAAEASAGDFYLSGQTGHSIGTGTIEGNNTLANFQASGEDTDTSPILGGAIGFEFLLGDAFSRDINLPKSMPWKLKLPNVGVRFEIEGLALRDYELTTDGITSRFPFHTDVSAFSVMLNNWFDVPIQPLVNRLFGRAPMLNPMSVFFGGGMGYSRAEASTIDASPVSGDAISNNFAYQFGGGIGYDLSQRFSITVGYRYLDAGSTKFDLIDGAGNNSGEFEVDMTSHEVLAALRVDFFSVPWPARSVRKHDW